MPYSTSACLLFLLLTTLTLAGVSRGGAASDTEFLAGADKRDTLRNLTGVEVVVEAIQEESLSTSDLRQSVEHQLEEAGIRVLRGSERLSQPGFPYLYVRVAVLHAAPASSYLLEISVNQTVSLTRQPSTTLFAPTWSMEGVGMLYPFSATRIREAVHDYVARFIGAYQAANPRDSAFP